DYRPVVGPAVDWPRRSGARAADPTPQRLPAVPLPEIRGRSDGVGVHGVEGDTPTAPDDRRALELGPLPRSRPFQTGPGPRPAPGVSRPISRVPHAGVSAGGRSRRRFWQVLGNRRCLCGRTTNNTVMTLERK